MPSRRSGQIGPRGHPARTSLLLMIATAAHALAGNDGHATTWAANVRERNPVLSHEDFLGAFPMQPADARARIKRSLTPAPGLNLAAGVRG